MSFTVGSNVHFKVRWLFIFLLNWPLSKIIEFFKNLCFVINEFAYLYVIYYEQFKTLLIHLKKQSVQGYQNTSVPNVLQGLSIHDIQIEK